MPAAQVTSPPRLELRLHQLNTGIAALSCLIALGVLAGWFLDIGWLVLPRPGFSPVRFNYGSGAAGLGDGHLAGP